MLPLCATAICITSVFFFSIYMQIAILFKKRTVINGSGFRKAKARTRFSNATMKGEIRFAFTFLICSPKLEKNPNKTTYQILLFQRLNNQFNPRNPFPIISLLLTIIINAPGSCVRIKLRSSTACPRFNTVKIIYFFLCA